MNNAIIYDKVNALIIQQLEKGVVPWKKPWTTNMPKNILSKKAYRGSNLWFLFITQEINAYKSSYWGTFNQIKALKGSVKKGQQSTPIIYWEIFKTTKVVKNRKGKEEEKETSGLFLRYYNVFNLDQTEGVKVPAETRDTLIENKTANDIISDYQKQIEIKFKGNQAFYAPVEDYIQLPARGSFINDDVFYATAFHEMTHSTGHTSRLNRPEAAREIHFGSELYSKEELIAEMGSAYLCSRVGITDQTIKQNATYIQAWLNALKADSSLLVSASGKAQKATDFILGIEPEETSKNDQKPDPQPHIGLI